MAIARQAMPNGRYSGHEAWRGGGREAGGGRSLHSDVVGDPQYESVVVMAEDDLDESGCYVGGSPFDRGNDTPISWCPLADGKSLPR